MKTEEQKISQAIAEMESYFYDSRFAGVKRLYSPRQVVEQQGAIQNDYRVAREAAVAFFNRLQGLFHQKKQITTFGPYTPGQAVMMKRAGIDGIYVGGWATSAKGSANEDPGSDLASYPLSQVPNEAAGIVRALLAADKNQHFLRMKMSEKERQEVKAIDFRPFIIADADTGHGGDAHVRNLIRRFVEVGVPGYHIEDQKPGTKKCGHQGGKVLVSIDEQIKRLNTARFQLDIMRVPGIIVARTDAEAASLLENMADERDQPFVLGATNLDIPSYKHAFLALQEYLQELGVNEIHGHELYAMSAAASHAARTWLASSGLLKLVEEAKQELMSPEASIFEAIYDKIYTEFVQKWEADAGVMTYRNAVYRVLKNRSKAKQYLEMDPLQWLEFSKKASLIEARKKAVQMGVDVKWDYELARTPEGFYQVEGGIPYAIAKSLAVAPYADILWMETKTANLDDAKKFADAIHKHFPEKMLAYNLSPSFNWDTTGMTEEEMSEFPEKLGEMGFVFNFVTYGGHQIDGLVSDEFANALQTEGMLALARIQRKLRLLDSPYKTPQTLVGGPRLDAALVAASGRTSTTKAMGKGSTQFQHLKQTELPPKLLKSWVDNWRMFYGITEDFVVHLRPHVPGSAVMELSIDSAEKEHLTNIVFTPVTDRNGRNILTVRDQNMFRKDFRQKRLMTLMHLYLLNRYGSETVHYLTPTPDNVKQCEGMKKMGIYTDFRAEVGQIIVAKVLKSTVVKCITEDSPVVLELIRKEPMKQSMASS